MMKTREYYNVRENEKETYNKLYNIELTETRYSRTDSGKGWKKNFDSQETNVIPFEHYFNYLSSVEFFRNLGGSERVNKAYTISGYIPTEMISISPEKDTRIVRNFKITRKEY